LVIEQKYNQIRCILQPSEKICPGRRTEIYTHKLHTAAE